MKNQFNFFQKHVYERMCKKVEGLLEEIDGGMDLKDALNLSASFGDHGRAVIQIWACTGDFVGLDGPDELVDEVDLKSIFFRLMGPESASSDRQKLVGQLREIADEIERVQQKT